MYNEIVKGALDGVKESNPPCLESKDEKVINEIVSQALTHGGYPSVVSSVIFDKWGVRIEGVLMNGNGVLLEFKYDFENGEFTTD